jgi:hypothetical protein
MLRGGHQQEGKVNEEIKQSEYGWCIFYTGKNIEHWNLLKSPYEGHWDRKQNNGENEPIQGLMHEYMEMS